MDELWYEKVSYEDKKELAKENLTHMVSSFIAAGYWIRSIWEDEGCKKDGYATIWEMAEAEFGLKKSEASRTINMNKKYSVGGYSPMVLEEYRMYNKSQLQEMLSIKKEELQQKVTVDMTVEEIRQLKKTGATPEELSMLREVMASFVQKAYVTVHACCQHNPKEQVLETIRELLDSEVPVKYGGKVFFTGEDKDDKDELVELTTGEVLATYSPDAAVTMVLEEYRKLHEIRLIKKKPDVSGLCDNAYCSECGEGLNEPDSGMEVSLTCPRCGQAVDWSGYQVEEAVATSQEAVSTVSDALLEAEIIEEIEADAEEVVGFLKFEDLDSEEEGIEEPEIIIDGEFREIPVDGVQEELSAYGLPKTVYPEGSILSTAGCGHKYACFCCAQDCGIRQENRYCVEAPLANPFSCTTMNVLKLLGEEMGDACQFKNQGLAYHTGGSHEPVPCCKQCQEKTCGYRCKRAMSAGMGRIGTIEPENAQAAAAGKSELDQTKDILEKEKQLLDEYLRIEDLPEFTVKRQKIIVGALANMVCELEGQETEEEPLEARQPELGTLRNNDQRQEFIADYEKWPVWIEQPLTGEKYYRYEFGNGTAFVVKAYFHKCFDYMSHAKKWEDRYKDGWGAEEYYIVTDGKHFKDCLANRSSMTEFLKNLQKGEK